MKAIRDKVKRFLQQNQMHSADVEIDHYVGLFLNEMEKGLAGRDSSLEMIPTYIEVDKDIPRNKPVIVLDAGGTHFRVASLHFDSHGRPVIEKFRQHPMPGVNEEVGKDEFFRTIAEHTTDVLDASDQTGFVFSYPTEILPDKDGKLIRFCKEVHASEVEGQRIGENLNLAIRSIGCMANKHIVILNDTVAALLAGRSAFRDRRFEGYIGFVLGTGSNCCYIESNRNITKKSGLDLAKKQIVNVESGSFGKGPRGTIDLELDESTADPGMYTFEKMFSGAYLGPLSFKTLQVAAKQNLFSGDFLTRLGKLDKLDTQAVSEFLLHPEGENVLASFCKEVSKEDRAGIYHILDDLVERAARLTAISLASPVLKSVHGRNPCFPVCITAEGTTFYELKSFKTRVECYLTAYLRERHGRYCEIVRVENATLIGAAIAGLTN